MNMHNARHRYAAPTICLWVLAACAPPNDRPQEPVRPFSYAEVEVRFDNPRADVTLAGTLTHPPGDGPFPGVILLHGSGRLDRNVVVARHQIFLVLADELTRRGFAVLRYDKRGVGQSTGDYDAHTSNDLGDDAVAAFDFMRTQAVVDSDHIGVAGISEGGMLGPAVANAVADVAFVVALGGPAAPGDELLQAQGDAIAAAEGDSLAQRDALRTLSERFNAFVRAGESRARLEERVRTLVDELAISERSRNGILGSIEVATSPWYRFMIDYDPRPVLAQLQQPILYFIGGKDLQVPVVPNLNNAELALANNADATVVSFAEINHALQPTLPEQTGSPTEYETIEQTIADDVLELVGSWMADRVR